MRTGLSRTACGARLARQGTVKVVFHTLRHTFASWLVQAGVPLYTVQRIMGHKTIVMTQRYAHLAPDQGAEAARLLSGISLAGEHEVA